MTTLLFQFTDGSALYSTTARWMASLLVWEANRVKDPAHVATLEKTVADTRLLQGPYVVICYKDDSGMAHYRIIDGQHRQTLVKAWLDADSTRDFAVLCRVHSVATPDDAIPLFQQINAAKPMMYKGSSTERLHEIVAALKKEFVSYRGSQAVALIRTHANRPFLSQECLESALKRYGIAERSTTIATIVAHAQHMNAFYAEDVSRCPATSAYTKNMLERATQFGFFLGLDTQCAWLLGLTS
jgi:hypothetical protein